MEKKMICKIKPSTETDLPHILELNKAAIPAVNLLSEQEIQNLFSQAEYFHSLWLNKEVIGFLIGLGPGAIYDSPNYRWFELRYDRFLYIDRIVIDPTHRGRGFGRLFYDNLRESVGQQFPKITCEVNLRPKNERSLRFHQGYGFRQVGTQETEGGMKHVSLMVYETP
jgi:hypothetical protein